MSAGNTPAGTTSLGDTDAAEAARPALRIVRGNPTPEQLAAVTVVLAAAGSGGAPTADESVPSRWASPARGVRSSVEDRLVPDRASAQPWWASALPR